MESSGLTLAAQPLMQIVVLMVSAVTLGFVLPGVVSLSGNAAPAAFMRTVPLTFASPKGSTEGVEVAVGEGEGVGVGAGLTVVVGDCGAIGAAATGLLGTFGVVAPDATIEATRPTMLAPTTSAPIRLPAM